MVPLLKPLGGSAMLTTSLATKLFELTLLPLTATLSVPS